MITALGIAMIASSARANFDYVLELFGGTLLTIFGVAYFWNVFVVAKSKAPAKAQKPNNRWSDRER